MNPEELYIKKDSWFWQIDDDIAYMDNPQKVAIKEKVFGKLSSEMVQFKKSLKLKIADLNYPSEMLTHDFQYFLERTKDEHMSLRVYNPEYVPWIQKERYSPMGGIWDKLDLKYILSVKERILPRKSTIRLSFMELLDSPVGDLSNESVCIVGDYAWIFSNPSMSQMRALFRKIIKSPADNRIEWARYFQNRIIERELSYTKYKKNSRKEVAWGDEEMLLGTSIRRPGKVSFRASFAERDYGIFVDPSQPHDFFRVRVYDVEIREDDVARTGLLPGNYRWANGGQLQDQEGNYYKRLSDTSDLFILVDKSVTEHALELARAQAKKGKSIAERLPDLGINKEIATKKEYEGDEGPR